MNKIETFQKWTDESKKIVFFTGAGVSCDSGIPDFRSTDGLYNQQYAYPPEEILSHTFFINEPDEFYRFYRDKMIYPEAKPNRTHQFIAKLEQMNKSLGVITQNIDGLHTEAGSTKVVELHGTILKNTCMKCHKKYGLDKIMNTEGIARCECGGIIKPDVVLYEEALDEMDLNQSVWMFNNADMVVVCGTSLKVWPAAGLLRYYYGNKLVLINKDRTDMDHTADLVFHDTLENVLSQIQL